MVIQCRACLNTKDTAFIRMDSHVAGGVDIYSCFTLCTQLNAALDDGLPGVLCSSCSQDLEICFNFVQNARQADVMLRNTLSQKSLADEVVESLETERSDIIMEPIVEVEDSEIDGCVVEEFIDDEPVLEEIVDDSNESNAIELMEVEKTELNICESSYDELEFIEDNIGDTTIKPADVVHEELDVPCKERDYYGEDENDDEYQREYKENEEEPDNPSKGSKWKCIECKRILCGDVSYEGHMNIHRSLRPYKCPLCLCAFRCKDVLEKHTQHRHRQENEGEFSLTNESCQDEDAIQTTNISCEKCTIVYETQEELREHRYLVHSETYPVQCRLCSHESPFTHVKLREHFRNDHPTEYRKYFPIVGRPLNESTKPTPWQCEELKCYTPPEVALRHHGRTHQNERPHECQFCSKRFVTTSNLRQHMRGVHTEEYEKLISEGGDSIVQCDLCKKQLLRRNLEKHLALHTKKEQEAKETQTKFLCAYCSRECKSQKTLNQHEKKHQEESSDTIYMCVDCDRSYATQHLLQQHRKQAHKERDHFCPICGNAFKLKNQLVNHMKLHLEKNIKCPHCDKCYARRFDLDVHMRSHTGELPFACHLCEKRFAIKVRLTYHLQKHYGVKHRCKECGAEFNSKQKLKAHSYKHTGMPYRCEKCDGHGFANRDVFKRHLQRVHCTSMSDEELVAMFQQNTGKSTRIRQVEYYEEPLDVGEPMKNTEEMGATLINEDENAQESEDIHTRQFSNAKSLSLHEHNVHLSKLEEPKYECEICERKCFQQRDLAAHMQRVHLAERKHICNICGNAFKSAWQLTAHKLLHAEDKSFQCEHCQHKYTRQADLSVHMRTHTGELPFACHLCDKRFAIKVRLTYHLQRHQGIKHPCTYCGHVYENRNQLREHLYKHTGMPYRCELCPDVGFTRRLRFSGHMQRVHNRKLSDEELAAVFTKYTGKAIHFNTSLRSQDSEDSQELPDFIIDESIEQ